MKRSARGVEKPFAVTGVVVLNSRKAIAALENCICKSYIKLTPCVSYIGIVFSAEEKTHFFSKIRSQKSRQTNLKYY